MRDIVIYLDVCSNCHYGRIQWHFSCGSATAVPKCPECGDYMAQIGWYYGKEQGILLVGREE